MKRMTDHLLLSCLVFAFSMAPVSAQLSQVDDRASRTVEIAGASVEGWKGNVHLTLPGNSASALARGENLPPGTVVDTDEGKLLLKLSDGGEVLIRPHTIIHIQQPSLTDPSYFQLLVGRIRALIRKRTGGAAPFELGTPSAVIAVRGTEFDVEVNRLNVTEVDVIDGAVEVFGRTAREESVLVEPGFSTRVGMNGEPEKPEPTEEMRPEVERNQSGAKGERDSDLMSEFERSDSERETESIQSQGEELRSDAAPESPDDPASTSGDAPRPEAEPPQ